MCCYILTVRVWSVYAFKFEKKREREEFHGLTEREEEKKNTYVVCMM